MARQAGRIKITISIPRIAPERATETGGLRPAKKWTNAPGHELRMVGTARCAVTARTAGGMVREITSDYALCAAARGADGPADRPYL